MFNFNLVADVASGDVSVIKQTHFLSSGSGGQYKFDIFSPWRLVLEPNNALF